MERLTNSEMEIMRIVWGNGGEIAETDLRQELHTKKGEVYARTTLATFLMKIEQKKYIRKERRGRNSYVIALVPADAFVEERLAELFNDFCLKDKERFGSLVERVLEK